MEPAKKPATVRYHFHFANAAERAYKTVVGGLTAASTVLFEGRVQPRHRTGPSHAGCVLKSKIGGCHEGEAARGTREARNSRFVHLSTAAGGGGTNGRGVASAWVVGLLLSPLFVGGPFETVGAAALFETHG